MSIYTLSNSLPLALWMVDTTTSVPEMSQRSSTDDSNTNSLKSLWYFTLLVCSNSSNATLYICQAFYFFHKWCRLHASLFPITLPELKEFLSVSLYISKNISSRPYSRKGSHPWIVSICCLWHAFAKVAVKMTASSFVLGKHT